MTDAYTPDPFKNFTPRQNPENPAIIVSNQLFDIDDMRRLSHEELKQLLERVIRAGWGFNGLTGKDLLDFARKSKDEIYEALKLRAAVLAYNATDARIFKDLASFWADREIGKAIERTETPAVQNTTNIYGLPQDVMEGMMRRYLEKCEKTREVNALNVIENIGIKSE